MCGVFLVVVGACGPGFAQWLKLDPPPDVDKLTHHGTTRNIDTCWLATTANMLAGAGYGTSLSTGGPQQRADAIYGQLVNNYGTTTSGWIDTSLSWWLANQNDAPGNPYDTVTVFGNKDLVPWSNANGMRFVGNQLRDCGLAGISVSFANASGNFGGHAITAWGDSGPDSTNPLTVNPAQITLADSDRDAGGNLQSYNVTWQNGAAGTGNYLTNYSNAGNQTFIKHVTTLTGGGDEQAVTSIKVHQGLGVDADGITYHLGLDVPIRGYGTDIDWAGKGNVTYFEDLGAGDVGVRWDFTSNMPTCNDLIITAGVTMDSPSAFGISDVNWLIGPLPKPVVPPHAWVIEDMYSDPTYLGYVIGRYFLQWKPDPIPPGPGPWVELRLLHQLDPTDDPMFHIFHLLNTGDLPFTLGGAAFGYSTGYLTTEELWAFDAWLTAGEGWELSPGEDYTFQIDFGELPIYFEQPMPQNEADVIPEPHSLLVWAACLALGGAAGLRIRRRRVASG